MSQFINQNSASSRRHFLAQSAFGVSSLALASLLNDEQLLAAPEKPALSRTVWATAVWGPTLVTASISSS